MNLERIFAKYNEYMKKELYILLFALGFCLSSYAQTGKNQSLSVAAQTSSNPPSIRFEWPAENFSGNYMIYKRNRLDTAWGSALVSLSGLDSSYTDTDVKIGEDYEYRFYKVQGASLEALSYLYSGIHKTAPESMGHMVLLIDSSYASALSFELNRLEEDLKAEAWSVERMYAQRNETAAAVKDRIYRKYVDRSEDLRALFIIGHVPVPYSGDFSGSSGFPPPDGHVEGSGNHTGAWPSDSYYGDIFGNYTDQSVNRTTGSQARLHNIPGDGKFDQTIIPGKVLIEIGRVDFFDMPAFAANDTQLLRNYFERNHQYRTARLKSVDRAVLDDNFTSLNLSSTGWQNLTAFFPEDSILARPAGDYFTALKSKPYLWSYGCGAGSYSSCNGVGRTSDFASDTLHNIFTMLAGSYFGDWDSRNNLMRAAIANSALNCFWGGIPKWYVHTMGLGMNIGYGAMATQNNIDNYFNGQFNFSHNKIHIALMGDPSLRLHYLEGASNLLATSAKNKVELEWTPSTEKVAGYMVYRIDKNTNRPFKIHSGIIDTTYFVDANNSESGVHQYMVRAMQYDTTTSGSYENLSYGIFTSVNHTFIAGIDDFIIEELFDIRSFPNPSNGAFELRFSSLKEQAIQVRLSDISGRVHLTEKHKTQTGINNIHFKLESLANGIYFIRLVNENGQSKTEKIMIQR